MRLAVDVGSVRIGVARSDPGGVLASPLTVVRSGPGDLDALATLAASAEAIEVIVGLPTSLSGREGAAAAAARSFAAELAGRLAPVPVRLVDERFTTTQAHEALRRVGKDSRARRSVVDAAAAAVLLQAALDAERATGLPPGQLVPPVGRTGGRDVRMTDNGTNWPPGQRDPRLFQPPRPMEPPPPLHHDPRAGDPRSTDPQRAGDSPWRRTQRHSRPEGAGWQPTAPAPAGHGAGPGPGEYRGGDPEPYRQDGGEEGDYDTGGQVRPWVRRLRRRGRPRRAAPPWPSRPRPVTAPAARGPPRRPRRRRFRWIAPLAALLVILIPVAIGGAYAYSFYMSKYHPADYSGPGTGHVVVQVTSGDTPTSLGPELTKLGVVASARAFVLAAEHSSNPDGLLPGFYGVHLHMKASLAYALLIDPKNLVQVTVTIPEGWRLSQIVAYLGAKSGIPAARLPGGPQGPGQAAPAALRRTGRPEGYLFPATYEVQPHETALGVLAGMVQRFDQEAAAGQPARGGQAGPPDRRPGHHHGQPGRSRGGPALGLPEDRPGDLQPAGPGHPAAAGQHGAVRAEHLRHHRQRRAAQQLLAVQHLPAHGPHARARSTARATRPSRPC